MTTKAYHSENSLIIPGRYYPCHNFRRVCLYCELWQSQFVEIFNNPILAESICCTNCFSKIALTHAQSTQISYKKLLLTIIGINQNNHQKCIIENKKCFHCREQRKFYYDVKPYLNLSKCDDSCLICSVCYNT